ncbi:MAG: hypothetical protein AAB767_00240 [Patescibacteria group bacterium]
MKRTPKKITLQTLDTKIGVLGQSLDKKIDGWGQSLDKKIGGLTDTVDALARSTNAGFLEVKKDVREFKTEMTEFVQKTSLTLFNLDSHARTANERLDAIEKTLEPLMFASGATQRELREHERRLSHIERKVGVVNK